jgi:anti-sigma regulatory factor (Ser/Thr protein kinase)
VTPAATRAPHGERLRLRHPAEPAQLRVLRHRVARWAREHLVPAQALIDLQLALGEAVSNGVEHAYPDGERGTVEVELELIAADAGPAISAQVVDHGRWRPIPFHKGGRGRGLTIIDQLTVDLRITSTDRGTQVSFAVPIR